MYDFGFMIFDWRETSADGMHRLVAAVYDYFSLCGKSRCECAAQRGATPKLLRGRRTAAMGCACEDHGPRQSRRDCVRGRVCENAGGIVAADCIRHARHGFSGAVVFERQEEEPRIARITRMNLDAFSNQRDQRNQRFAIFLPCGREYAGRLGTRGFVVSHGVGTCGQPRVAARPQLWASLRNPGGVGTGSCARREHPISRGLSGGMPVPRGRLALVDASFAFRWRGTGETPVLQHSRDGYAPFSFSFASSSAYSAPPRFVSFASRWHATGWKPVVQDRLEAYPTPRRRHPPPVRESSSFN